MEYKLLRTMNIKGVKYEKNQLVNIDSEDEAKVLQEYNFIEKKRTRKTRKKS